MTAFPRNTPALLFRRGASNLYGEQLDLPPVEVRVAVVSFSDRDTPTPIRGEQSASRGRADMEAGSVLLLFGWDETVKVDDRVEVYGVSLKVVDVFPRADLFGRLSGGHLSVTLTHELV